MQNYKRSARVGELIQQEISKILLEIRDPHFGFVTVMGVKITDDLKNAKVFYSVLGNEEDKIKAKNVLDRAAHFIRYSLGKRISLRFLPSLEFVHDDTPEKAGRVFDLLRKIEEEKAQPKKAPKKKTKLTVKSVKKNTKTKTKSKKK